MHRKDGTVIIALQWDYAVWTKLASDFEEQIRAREKEATGRLVAVSGMEIATLARDAGMSLSTFHAHFKAVTSSSPLQ